MGGCENGAVVGQALSPAQRRPRARATIADNTSASRFCFEALTKHSDD
jgi:hypothetical protein